MVYNDAHYCRLAGLIAKRLGIKRRVKRRRFWDVYRQVGSAQYRRFSYIISPLHEMPLKNLLNSNV